LKLKIARMFETRFVPDYYFAVNNAALRSGGVNWSQKVTMVRLTLQKIALCLKRSTADMKVAVTPVSMVCSLSFYNQK